MGYPTGFDADVECVSSDEKSDTEGKNETTSSISSNNNTGNSTADTSATLEVRIALKLQKMEVWGLGFHFPLGFSVLHVRMVKHKILQLGNNFQCVIMDNSNHIHV